jgi:hypothetical protein
MAFVPFAAFSVYAGWGLARGSTSSVVQRAKLALWVILPLASVILFALVPFITLGSINNNDLVVAFVYSVIIAGLWTAYLSKSKRVQEMYDQPFGDATRPTRH